MLHSCVDDISGLFVKSIRPEHSKPERPGFSVATGADFGAEGYDWFLRVRKIRSVRLTANQTRGFVASWMGIMLDGVDSFIYALVLVPAMKELLPRSGIEASAGNLGYFGSILFSMFLIGWGLAFLWGPLACRFRRRRS